MVTLDDARLNISACALGTARGALEIALDHARTREAFGQPIIRHQGLAFLLADVVTEVAAARALWLEAIRAVAAGAGRVAVDAVRAWRRTRAARPPCAPPPRPCRCSAAPA